MKYTLLDLTQTILSSMDSDEINSIHDTPEARQVVTILRTVYYDLAARDNIPRDDNVFQLVASGSSLKPTVMTLPSDVTSVDWVKYDYQTADDPGTNYTLLKPMPLTDFLGMVSAFDPDEDNVVTYTHAVGTNVFTLYCKNDAPPQYYTTTDDKTVFFDSFDLEVDTTLQSVKTMCYGHKTFPWQDVDTFVPPLDEPQHQLLLQEAKALAWAELKQAQHLKAEKMARDIRIRQQVSKTKIPLQSTYDQTIGYGRHRR